MNYSQINAFKKRAKEMLDDGKRMYSRLTKKSPAGAGDKIEAAMHGLSKSAGKVLKASSYEEISNCIPGVLDHYLTISLEYNRRL